MIMRIIKVKLPLENSLIESLMREDAFMGQGVFSVQQWKELDQGYSLFMIAPELARPQKMLGLILSGPVFAHCNAHLFKIVVNPTYRGKGMASAAMQEWFKILMQEGATGVYLEVDELNTVALKLYKGLGFKTLCVKKAFYSDGHNALAMELIFPK